MLIWKCSMDKVMILRDIKTDRNDIYLLLLLVLISPFPWGDTINIFKCTGKMKLIFVSDSGTDVRNR